MEMSELRHKSIVELKEQLAEFSRELLDYRMQHSGRTLTKTHMLAVRRRDIARIRTMLGIRQSKQEAEAGQKEIAS